MEYTDILCEEKADAVWITINRPKVYNAVTTHTLKELAAALWAADRDKAASVVITGGGDRAFCTGGDVNEMRDLNSSSGRVFLRAFVETVEAIRGIGKPVIARVDGFCLGGGNEINIACDLTIASDRSFFGQVGPTVGSVPVIGATQFLPRIVGEKRAREIIFLCRRYSAEDALKMGWINMVVPAAELDNTVVEWTARIAEMSSQSIRVAKLSLNHAGDSLQPSLNHGVEMLTAIYGTDEFREGMNAFLEKRKPDFRKFR